MISDETGERSWRTPGRESDAVTHVFPAQNAGHLPRTGPGEPYIRSVLKKFPFDRRWLR
jgi:hypothetical protein